MNSSLEELIKITVIFILFPGRQLNAASRKSLEIQASSLAKRRTLSNPKFVYVKVFSYCNTS